VANITIHTATASAGQSPAARKNGLNPSDHSGAGLAPAASADAVVTEISFHRQLVLDTTQY
jgi:hypothetical protein